MTIPGRTREVKQNIESYGQHLSQVFGDGSDPGFIYTIGNADRGLPELLLIGDFPSHIAAGLLNELGAKMREDGKPLATGLVDIGWSIPVKVRQAGPLARSRYTIRGDRARRCRLARRHDQPVFQPSANLTLRQTRHLPERRIEARPAGLSLFPGPRERPPTASNQENYDDHARLAIA
ncbi:DUF4262 domain-containing protein [Aquibium oceanicum]|uniref:Uncharacterized protein n=1 Tax=Aquibium oceanicum TaxID=1670800 RepID=A0A1L3SZL4_9HYPH|nr:DUF4262 domain-containing protein [Aquibium oceanicum]APH74873.1 hypothetical protein BSQ44_25570 [Aquibium oceanicum]